MKLKTMEIFRIDGFEGVRGDVLFFDFRKRGDYLTLGTSKNYIIPFSFRRRTKVEVEKRRFLEVPPIVFPLYFLLLFE